jgi:hypothetical protein
MDGGLIVVLPELSGTMGGWVLKFYLAIAASVLLATPSAAGQYFEVVSACTAGATEFCNTAQSQRNQLAQCIKVHFEELGES